ncbi:hypothetical protein PMAYCL1PPCAC_14865, partial [Pristionchus mayeri]
SLHNCFLRILIFHAHTFTFFPFNHDESERLIDESRFYLSWVRSRGAYFRIPATTFVHLIIRVAILCLLLCMAFAMIPFCHMLYVLNKQTQKSERS